MHLEYERCLIAPPVFSYEAIRLYHRELDDVGLCPLHRRVDSHALRLRAKSRNRRFEAREIAAAAEERLGVSEARGLGFGVFNISCEPGEILEVLREECRRLLARDRSSQSRTQGIDPHTIEDAEVDDLGAAPHLVIH